MQFYSFFNQGNRGEVDALVRYMPYGTLLTAAAGGEVRQGIFNHIYDGKSLFLHLNRKDEQILDMRAKPRALFTLTDFLAVIPSYWVDEVYGGAATSYYRYAEFDCSVEISEDAKSMQSILQNMLDLYQPEKGYEPLSSESTTYASSFQMLSIVRLNPKRVRTKWKLGQNRSTEVRRRVASELRRRGLPNDARTADEIERTIS